MVEFFSQLKLNSPTPSAIVQKQPLIHWNKWHDSYNYKRFTVQGNDYLIKCESAYSEKEAINLKNWTI